MILYISRMEVLIVPDSFKESLSAEKVTEAIKMGVASIFPNAKCVELPFSDGGEGALPLLKQFAAGKQVFTATEDALGRKVKSPYFLFENSPAAWIELAQASGLAQIEKEKRNPLISSTFGTGIQIKDALERGCKTIYLGIGGSATNDAGCGIFQALGGQLIGPDGKEIAKGGGGLANLKNFILPKLPSDINWIVACDVNNPLIGENGASHVYAPQKGATPKEVEVLEKAMLNFATVVEKSTGKKIENIPGGGAAGGTAAGMHAFFNAALKPGFELLAQLVGLEEKIKTADLIFTAEGSIDAQSMNGKVPISVARLAKKHSTSCVGLAGKIAPPFSPYYAAGFSALQNIQHGAISLQKSEENAFQLISETAANLCLTFQHLRQK